MQIINKWLRRIVEIIFGVLALMGTPLVYHIAWMWLRSSNAAIIVSAVWVLVVISNTVLLLALTITDRDEAEFRKYITRILWVYLISQIVLLMPLLGMSIVIGALWPSMIIVGLLFIYGLSFMALRRDAVMNDRISTQDGMAAHRHIYPNLPNSIWLLPVVAYILLFALWIFSIISIEVLIQGIAYSALATLLLSVWMSFRNRNRD